MATPLTLKPRDVQPFKHTGSLIGPLLRYRCSELSYSSDSLQWPKLIGAAAASSLATLFVVRNFFPEEKKVRHPIRADYTVGEDTFVRTMGHLLGPPLEKGKN